MESFSEYIKGFASGVKSLLIGMRTSMKVFCQPKVTEQYPENRHTTLHIPERHRLSLLCHTTMRIIITALPVGSARWPVQMARLKSFQKCVKMRKEKRKRF